ncbi:MAG: NAD(P)/FAD-dependent oxidoreductase [Acidimicrobiales bacterium]
MNDATRSVDVAIVGGGIAGLVAATRLLSAGLTCAVFESQDRVGGRLKAHRSVNGSFDLGASWFWPGETRVAELIRELGVPTHAHHLAGDALFHTADGVQRIDGNPIDVESGRFTDSAESLVEHLAERLVDIIFLKTTVVKIAQHGETLTVTHTTGSLNARHVVLALPPSVAVGTIEIEPALPDQLGALAASTPVWMGEFAKVVVVYADAFWRNNGLSGSAISHLGPLREIHDMSGVGYRPAALFGFVPLDPDVPAPSVQQVIEQLVALFGPEAGQPLEVVVKDWRAEAHLSSLGANQATPGQTYGHRAFQEPAFGGRLHWASTETATQSPGHIEGAIGAAERAVQTILSNR